MNCDVTLAIIKPDAIMAGNAGRIITAIEKSSLAIVGMKIMRLSAAQAELFYSAHREKPFFTDLIAFMISERNIILALKGDDAVNNWRKLIGHTNPALAENGTIRHSFGSTIERNAVHGADSYDSAIRELRFFFGDMDYDLLDRSCPKV
jgi:nucleoside-diphosphate kinase